MDKPRKPYFRDGRKLSDYLFSTSYDTEENVVEQTEVLDNNDSPKKVLLNQILNEVKELSNDIKEMSNDVKELSNGVKEISNDVKEVRSLVGQILEGQVNMEKSILNRLTIFEECINRNRT